MARITNALEHAGRETLPDEVGAHRAGSWLSRYCRVGWLIISLSLVAAAPFLPILDHGFVNWDDPENFLENYRFRGLGAAQIRWAWTTMLLGVYQPLAWMLLEAQYALWGLAPEGYHAVSIILHAANAVTLYALAVALLHRCLPREVRTDRWAVHGASALAALLFATHPLRVEVVSWVSCQPYLPCALLSMLSVLAYLRAVGPSMGRHRVGWLVVAWLLLAGALLCKAPAVSVPAVLLILDMYPLRRLGPGRWSGPEARRVWMEKIPFFALSLAFMAIALWAKTANGTLKEFGDYDASARVAQACYGVCFYLVKAVWPTGLTAFYPLPERIGLRAWPYWACALVVVALSLGAVLLRRRWPGLPAAWAAYLVILAPTLGLAQISKQLVTDRYSYLATLAPVMLLAYGLARLAHRVRMRTAVRAGLLVAGLGIVAVESALSWRQCGTWRSSEALWTNALAHGGQDTVTILLNLGGAWYEAGKLREARACFEEVLRLNPDQHIAHYNIGRILYDQGRIVGAAAQFAEALRVNSDYANACYNLGVILADRGRLGEAETYYRRAIRIKPDDPAAHNNLGVVLFQQGRLDEAARHFAEALRLRPDYRLPREGLDHIRRLRGRVASAP